MTENADSVLRLCRQEEPWLLDTLEALVRLESPSTNKEAVDRCGREIARRLEGLGARVTRLPATSVGDHIRAEFPAADGARQVLLLGHFDTVWSVGQIARMPYEVREGRLHGPGVFDMKAGLSVALQAARVIFRLAPDAPRRAAPDQEHAAMPRVVMLWTTDEEIGSGTSRAFIEEEARRSDAVLVLEPSLPGGAAKTSRKGCGDFELRVHGVSAHAGIDPGKGSNAIHELAHQILAIAALQDVERGVSVNVGIVSGGTRTNVIPDEARATIDVRAPTMEDAARVEAAIRARAPRLAGTRLEIAGGFGRPPLERGPHVVRLYEIARDVARRLGADLREGGTGGGSDGNFTSALGVPTLDGLGPQGDGAHALHEHVLVADLSWRAAFLAILLNRLGEVD
jgi:glutamate carboxypeptidase